MQDSDGYTALMFAAENGRELVVELLLQHGAEISLQRRRRHRADGRRLHRPRAGSRLAHSARR